MTHLGPRNATAFTNSHVPDIDRVRTILAAVRAIGPARTCQYPKWGDEPPTHEYCGKRTLEGSSYCPKHHAACRQAPWPYRPAQRKRLR